MEIEHHVVGTLLVVPLLKLLVPFGGHDFGNVVVDNRDFSHVLLVFVGVQLVRKVPLFDFCEIEGFRKSREWYLEQTQGINETDVVVGDFQEFTPAAELLNDAVWFGIGAPRNTHRKLENRGPEQGLGTRRSGWRSLTIRKNLKCNVLH